MPTDPNILIDKFKKIGINVCIHDEFPKYITAQAFRSEKSEDLKQFRLYPPYKAIQTILPFAAMMPIHYFAPISNLTDFLKWLDENIEGYYYCSGMYSIFFEKEHDRNLYIIMFGSHIPNFKLDSN